MVMSIGFAPMKKNRTLTPQERKESGRLRAIWDQRKAEWPHLTQEWAAHEMGWHGQTAVQQYLSARIPLGDEALLKFAVLLKFDPREVRQTIDRIIPDALRTGPRHSEHRQVPMVSCDQAGAPEPALEDSRSTVGVDEQLAQYLSVESFAMPVEDESMAPDFQPHDIVIVDPHEEVRPGDYVVAVVGEEVLLRRYRERGQDENGPIWELLPINSDYAPIMVDSHNPGRIVGPVIEHRRKRR